MRVSIEVLDQGWYRVAYADGDTVLMTEDFEDYVDAVDTMCDFLAFSSERTAV